METDWELIQACRSSDERAWQRLIDRYERLVMSIPMRYGTTLNDAEDVAQRTFIIMLESLDRFHAESNLSAWLITVARRQSWRVLQRYDREQVQQREDLSEGALLLNMGVEDQHQDWFVIERLHAALQALDDRCRRLLFALYFERDDPSYDELAERFALSRNSIGAIRGRCLQRLQRLMARTNGDET